MDISDVLGQRNADGEKWIDEGRRAQVSRGSIRSLSAHTGAEIHDIDVGKSLPDKTILEIRLAHT